MHLSHLISSLDEEEQYGLGDKFSSLRRRNRSGRWCAGTFSHSGHIPSALFDVERFSGGGEGGGWLEVYLALIDIDS